MSRHHIELGKVPAKDWVIDHAIPAGRRSRLLDSPDFEKIVLDICRTLSVLDHKRERSNTNPDYYRFTAVISLKARAVDLFHNSATGYRAQYYLGRSIGEGANRLACDKVGESVLAKLEGRFKRTTKPDWAAKSLAAPGAKIWIHQGLWLRHAKRLDRTLTVRRWRRNIDESTHSHAAKLGRWASLMPKTETRMVLKGGFLTKTGRPLGQHKDARTRSLNELGFT